MKKIENNNRGLTLIELLVVISLVGLLASIILVAVKGAKKKAATARLVSLEAQAYHALGAYSVGIYDFSKITDNTLPDLSGDGNNGILMGSPVVSPDTPTGEGNSLYFDGGENFVKLIGPILSTTFDNFTISAWYKSCDTSVSEQYIFELHDITGNATITLSTTDDVGNERKTRLNFGPTTSKRKFVYGTSNIVDEKWHFLLVSKDGDNVKIYVDAVLEADENGSQGYGGINAGGQETGRASIGTGSWTYPDHLVCGWIYNLRLYGAGLTSLSP